MSKKVSRMKVIVEDCLRKLVKHYEEQEEDFLTEGDVAASLFCMLKDDMKKQGVEGFKVHVGLRPYNKLKLVLKAKDTAPEEWEWKKHYPKNSGAVVDVVIIDEKREYFKQACTYEKLVIAENRGDFEQIPTHEKKKIKKYWRLVSYPLEAFAVCIEIKIRVSGNMDRIKKDINELRKIRESEKDCLVYLVIVDRKALENSTKKFRKYCSDNGVTWGGVSPVQTLTNVKQPIFNRPKERVKQPTT